jgi:excinuclease ABC subunit A
MTCGDCGSARLRPEALYVRVNELTIAQASDLPIHELTDWVMALETPKHLSTQEFAIAESDLVWGDA